VPGGALATNTPLAQLAEAKDLKSLQSKFEMLSIHEYIFIKIFTIRTNLGWSTK